ncbi:dTDP-4-dehydrorhamnose reductase [Thioalkalivibrio sulfidiphilus]|uniref:dTDP-4-dehydrorhamnose reductase n=1 Tax=Thioalkalivibrio sulfidiphilus TaxID=1033854 RepID=UPI000372B1EA|nr:dTDP-4-dehydrorhamnose reductase [Thioalkalivibrio sulfidiphilus]
MKQILLFGRDGQVAYELRRTLASLGRVTVAARDGLGPCADLADPDQVRSVIRDTRPDIVVNAAAYTAVDAAEADAETAMAINGIAPGIMAEEASQIGAWLIHYSTDYVFDGSALSPYQETDATAPLGVYGQSKLAGEQAIAASGVAHLILRTAWVYGARGRNFLATIQRLAREREQLRIVNDQIGAPTWSRSIAEATSQILAQGALTPDYLRAHQGIYHLTCQGQCTWYEFARAIVEAMDPAERRANVIEPIATAEFPTPAKRPAYSVLSNKKLSQAFGITLPDWRDALSLCLEDLSPKGHS